MFDPSPLVFGTPEALLFGPNNNLDHAVFGTNLPYEEIIRIYFLENGDGPYCQKANEAFGKFVSREPIGDRDFDAWCLQLVLRKELPSLPQQALAAVA